MDQRKVVDALAAVSMVGAILSSFASNATVNGTETVMVNPAYLQMLGARNLEAMRILTIEIFGGADNDGS
jgi:hypothetical protein